jgi:hypothetical protein
VNTAVLEPFRINLNEPHRTEINMSLRVAPLLNRGFPQFHQLRPVQKVRLSYWQMANHSLDSLREGDFVAIKMFHQVYISADAKGNVRGATQVGDCCRSGSVTCCGISTVDPVLLVVAAYLLFIVGPSLMLIPFSSLLRYVCC